MKNSFYTLYPFLMLSILCSTMLNAVDGVLDTTFNPAGNPPGTLFTVFGTDNDTAYAVVVQPTDQKIVLVGTVTDTTLGEQVFGLARYNPDGSLDSSFDSDGKVITPQVPGATGSGAVAAALQPDGKIVAAGSALIGVSSRFALIRYNTDGTLDGSFGTGGVVTTIIGTGSSEANAVVVRPDGRIIAGGVSVSTVSGNPAFTLAIYDTTGMLINTVQTDILNSNSSVINALAFDPVTGFLVATGGASMDTTGVDEFATARYSNPIIGTLDPTFNPGQLASIDTQPGVVVTTMPNDLTPEDSDAFAITIQPDQKIIVGGQTNDFTQGAFVRYLPSGFLDTAFGPTGGRIILPFTGNFIDAIYGLGLQVDGKIIVAGTTFSQSPFFEFFVGRYLTTGFVDPTFNPGSTITGFNFTTIEGSDSEAFAVALQADQKIVLAGDVANDAGGFFNFAAARYNGLIIVPPCPLLQTPRSDIIQAIMNKYCIC